MIKKQLFYNFFDFFYKKVTFFEEKMKTHLEIESSNTCFVRVKSVSACWGWIPDQTILYYFGGIFVKVSLRSSNTAGRRDNRVVQLFFVGSNTPRINGIVLKSSYSTMSCTFMNCLMLQTAWNSTGRYTDSFRIIPLFLQSRTHNTITLEAFCADPFETDYNPMAKKVPARKKPPKYNYGWHFLHK